jgi:hypothetical protein
VTELPKDFDACVAAGGRVRTVSGSKAHGLKKDEYVRYCFPKGGGAGIRGEVQKKEKEKK